MSFPLLLAITQPVWHFYCPLSTDLLVFVTVRFPSYRVRFCLSLSPLIDFLSSTKLLIAWLAELWRRRDPFTRWQQEPGFLYIGRLLIPSTAAPYCRVMKLSLWTDVAKIEQKMQCSFFLFCPFYMRCKKLRVHVTVIILLCLSYLPCLCDFASVLSVVCSLVVSRRSLSIHPHSNTHTPTLSRKQKRIYTPIYINMGLLTHIYIYIWVY